MIKIGDKVLVDGQGQVMTVGNVIQEALYVYIPLPNGKRTGGRWIHVRRLEKAT